MLRFVCVCLTFGLALWAFGATPEAHAQRLSANPFIQKGQLQYNAQNYNKAVAAFKQALASRQTSKEDRTTALRYLGFISIILNRGVDARGYFLRLLRLDPKYQLDPLTPPKLMTAFKIVRKEYMAKRQVAIEMMISQESPTDQPLEMRMKVRDFLKQVKKVVLWYRVEDQPSYTRALGQEVKNANWKSLSFSAPSLGPWIKLKGAALCQKSAPATSGYRFFSYTIPKFVGKTQAYYIEYYVVAYGAKQKFLASYGSAKSPKSVKRTVPDVKEAPKPKASVTSQWWFWTAIIGGVVVVGGATTAIILATQGPPPAPDTGGAIVTVIQRTQ